MFIEGGKTKKMIGCTEDGTPYDSWFRVITQRNWKSYVTVRKSSPKGLLSYLRSSPADCPPDYGSYTIEYCQNSTYDTQSQHDVNYRSLNCAQESSKSSTSFRKGFIDSHYFHLLKSDPFQLDFSSLWHALINSPPA